MLLHQLVCAVWANVCQRLNPIEGRHRISTNALFYIKCQIFLQIFPYSRYSNLASDEIDPHWRDQKIYPGKGGKWMNTKEWNKRNERDYWYNICSKFLVRETFLFGELGCVYMEEAASPPLRQHLHKSHTSLLSFMLQHNPLIYHISSDMTRIFWL